MSMRTKLEFAIGVALLAVAAFFFSQWKAAHDEFVNAQATSEAPRKVAAQLQQQIQDLKDADARRAAATQATLDAMQKAAARVLTPAAISKWIPQQLNTPAPVTLNIPPATPHSPPPPAIATVPQADLPAIRDIIEACKECNVKLQAAQQTVASKDEQLKIAGAQLSAVENERDAWKKAAKGTLWSRTKTAARYILIGGAIGAGALCGTGHCK